MRWHPPTYHFYYETEYETGIVKAEDCYIARMMIACVAGPYVAIVQVYQITDEQAEAMMGKS